MAFPHHARIPMGMLTGKESRCHGRSGFLGRQCLVMNWNHSAPATIDVRGALNRLARCFSAVEQLFRESRPILSFIWRVVGGIGATEKIQALFL